MPDWLPLALLIPAGVIAGIVNSIAGGGSFLTLPALMLTGLPDQVANGTNRIAVLMQTVFASYLYHQHERLDRKVIGKVLVPMLPGALVGAYLASEVDPKAFQGAVGLLFLAFSVLMIAKRRRLIDEGAVKVASRPVAWASLFGVGVYGGFLQAGVGLLLLLSLSASLGTDLAGSNALRQSVVAVWVVPVLAWFAYRGQVQWLPGIILGVGNLVGAKIGTRLAIEKGNGLIFACLVAVMLLTAARSFLLMQ